MNDPHTSTPYDTKAYDAAMADFKGQISRVHQNERAEVCLLAIAANGVAVLDELVRIRKFLERGNK